MLNVLSSENLYDKETALRIREETLIALKPSGPERKRIEEHARVLRLELTMRRTRTYAADIWGN